MNVARRPIPEQLALFGPDAPPWRGSVREARTYCQTLATSHYENFSVASALLPRRLVPHFQAVYAWCRWADDLGDECGGGRRALGLLDWWLDELDWCYLGEAKHPVTAALAKTVREFAIPPEPFRRLVRAFAQDQRMTRYETIGNLLGYCRNSADPVGHLVLHLARAYNPESARLSDLICSGLQLANMWQDVRRDKLDLDRVYIPREDANRFGVAWSDVEALRFTPEAGELMRFQVERTRRMFEEGSALIDRVPAFLRPELELIVAGGLGILRKIERANYDSFTARPVLSKRDKASIVLAALGRGAVRWLRRGWAGRRPTSGAGG